MQEKLYLNTEIVKIDPYVKEYFTDGVLINRLQGQYTSKEIAEAFSNASKVSEWMRGEKGNALQLELHLRCIQKFIFNTKSRITICKNSFIHTYTL